LGQEHEPILGGQRDLADRRAVVGLRIDLTVLDSME
jgi:hypothetical protein